MRFQVEQRFRAPLPDVEDALLDPAFLATLADRPALGSPQLLDQEVEGDVVRRSVRYHFGGTLSPRVAAMIDPDRLTWVEVTTFDRRAHRGEHRIVPDHYAGRLDGSYVTRLDGEEDGTVRSAAGEVRVRFALVGGRVERAIVDGVVAHAGHEAELLGRWLEEQG